LDENGLLYVWGKIKALVPTRTSQLTNDSNFITLSDVPGGAVASTTTPKMSGTAATGTETAYARGDHVHPSDTSKVDKETGKGLSTNDLTDALKAHYDAAYTHSQNAYTKSEVYTKTEVDEMIAEAGGDVDLSGYVKTEDAITNAEIDTIVAF